MKKKPRVRFISPEEAESADVIVCMPFTMPLILSDNLLGNCARCGAPVQYRPHVPRRPVKLCPSCAVAQIKKERDGAR